MKTQLSFIAATGLLFAASHLPAQTTGVSHPEALDDTITVQQPAPPPQPVQQPAPIPAVATPAPILQTSPVLHDRAATTTAPIERVTAADAYTNSDAGNDADDSAPPANSTPPSAVIANDDNSGVVISVPSAPNQLPQGTMIRVRLNHQISTRNTEPDVQFNAYVAYPIVHDGQTVIPAGSILTGRVTELSDGHHIGHAASIHLQPDFITLPSGAHYTLNAQVIDLSSDHRTRVNNEGTIIGNDPTPGTATAVGVSTGAGAVTGAVLGGGVGAVVGAGVGAGVSGGIWARQHTSETLPQGTEIIFSLNQPMLLANTIPD
jgi:hypothetical protein